MPLPLLATGALAAAPLVASGIRGLANRPQRRRENRQMNRAVGDTNNLRELFLGRAQQPLTQGATFQAGMGTLRDVMGDRAQSDASAAVGRGLAGGEFEIAQAANRGQMASGFLRNLFGQAEQSQRADFNQAIDVQAILNSLLSGNANRREHRNAQNQHLIAGAVQNALLASQGGGAA